MAISTLEQLMRILTCMVLLRLFQPLIHCLNFTQHLGMGNYMDSISMMDQERHSMNIVQIYLTDLEQIILHTRQKTSK